MWFSHNPTPEVLQWIDYYNIPYEDTICEIGCGEGRDSLYLAEKGFIITAMDISEEAIRKCKELANERKINANWIIADAITWEKELEGKFQWVFSVGVLHMLVEDEDRLKFLSTLHSILSPKGKCLLLNKGDGENEIKTDISKAFKLEERTHLWSGENIKVATTSYRAINWDNHIKELNEIGFSIEKIINSTNNEYDQNMVVYLVKER